MLAIACLTLPSFFGAARAVGFRREPGPELHLVEQNGPPRVPHAQQPKGPWGPTPPGRLSRKFIWNHRVWGENFPDTAYGYPYVRKPLDVIAAEEEGQARFQDWSLKPVATNKEAQVQARMKEYLQLMDHHRAKAAKLSLEARGEERNRHFSSVFQVPLDTLAEPAEAETPECARAPWPPHEEEAAPQAPKQAGPEVAGPGPAVQGEAERPVKEAQDAFVKESQAKRHGFYLKKLERMFAGLDVDEDGAIAEEEIYAFFDGAWRAYDPKELLQKFLAEADEDHDGQVAAAEWYTFADGAQQSSQGKAEWWDPLEHLKRGARSSTQTDMERNVDQPDGYYERFATRIFHVMDLNKNDFASKSEIQAFLGKNYHTKDPAEFSENVLAEADTDGDSNVTIEEFLNFAAESRKTSRSHQERWNPLLHIINNVRRSRALGAMHTH